MRVPRAEARAWQELDDRYVEETGNVEHELAAVILWADAEGIATPGANVLDYRIERLSAALQADVARDDCGCETRNRYCKTVHVRDEEDRPIQRTLWAHFDQATFEFREASLYQRWRGIGSDVAKLQADERRHNADGARRGRPPMQLSFNWDIQNDDEADAS